MGTFGEGDELGREEEGGDGIGVVREPRRQEPDPRE